MPFKVDISTE